MTMIQMYPPANLIAVCRDRDYLKYTPEETFLKHLYALSNLECQNLEVMTRGQAQNEEWQKQRCYCLSSSRFGKICKAATANKMKLADSLTEYKEV